MSLLLPLSMLMCQCEALLGIDLDAVVLAPRAVDSGSDGGGGTGATGGSAGSAGCLSTDGSAGECPDAAACGDGACAQCEPGLRDCSGNAPRRCIDGGISTAPVCSGTAPRCGFGECRATSCALSDTSCRSESCCATLDVTGGTFNRNNDPRYPAQLSAFKLDRYEVTVGRFRGFVVEYASSASDAGRQPWIDGRGWNPDWNALFLPADQEALIAGLKCAADATWTDTAAGSELLPINCVSWYVAFAFCAWDGGRLPTLAEWNFAAAGGGQQRRYPWSVPPTNSFISDAHAVYLPQPIGPVGSKSTVGDGLFEHADLGGNVAEWVLDVASPLTADCNDCAALGLGQRAVRGGSYRSSTSFLTTFAESSIEPDAASADVGLRCARSP